MTVIKSGALTRSEESILPFFFFPPTRPAFMDEYEKLEAELKKQYAVSHVLFTMSVEQYTDVVYMHRYIAHPRCQAFPKTSCIEHDIIGSAEALPILCVRCAR